MRKIGKISKLELSILFYSPVAWLVLTIFFIQNGIGFLDAISFYQRFMALGRDLDDLTNDLFAGRRGLFTLVQENLYLYIPLLTMGLMSRETSSGSIKLLLSSPVKIREIILGKYLAIISYGGLLILILAVYSIVGALVIKDVDISLVFSGLIGLYLLICTYAAIGLFMSSLTTYQVVAAISTLAVFALLRFIGLVGQETDFVRDLTYFLSISGRADDIVGGLIKSNDVFYFLIIITLFLSLCILRLQSGREAKSWTVQTARYTGLIGGALLLGYLTSRPAFIGYKDMTADKYRTLTRASQAVAAQIKGPLEITTYVNLMDGMMWQGLPRNRNEDRKRLEQYQRFIPGLEMKYVYYYDSTEARFSVINNKDKGLNFKQLAEKAATSGNVDFELFMPPSEIHKLVDLHPEGNRLVRKLDYKGKSSFLRFYDGEPFPDEMEITASIKRLVTEVPKLAFVTGDNERSIDKTGDRNYQHISGMKRNRFALINHGFDIDSIDLRTQEIPERLAALVLGDPTIPLSASEQQKLVNYIGKGGNLLVTGSPGRQSLLNPLLQSLGVRMKEGMLVNPSKDFSPDLLFGQLTKQAAVVDSGLGTMAHWNAKVTMQGSVALESFPVDSMRKFMVLPLVLSPEGGWNKRGAVDLSSTDVKYDSAGGDEKAIFPLALALTRTINNRQQRIMILGNADFMSNVELSRMRGKNLPFTFGLFRWFSNGVFPIDNERPEGKDNLILVSKKQISSLKVICLGVIPALLLLGGTIVLLRRRRK